MSHNECYASFCFFYLNFWYNKTMKEKIVEILIGRGIKLLKQPWKEYPFTNNPEADDLLNDIKHYPHAFILGCIMDRGIKAEKAWQIPYKIHKEIGSFEFSKLLSLQQKRLKKIFRKNSLHRWNNKMAECFYSAVQKIHNDYNGDISNLWQGKPKSATVVKRFLQFNGVGVKIATMTANILVRRFKIPMSDHINIDISPDIHVKRVFGRVDFMRKDASNDEMIYCARELNQEYPGVFDFSCWEIGRNWCRPQNPSCGNCYLDKYCPKII